MPYNGPFDPPPRSEKDVHRSPNRKNLITYSIPAYPSALISGSLEVLGRRKQTLTFLMTLQIYVSRILSISAIHAMLVSVPRSFCEVFRIFISRLADFKICPAAILARLRILEFPNKRLLSSVSQNAFGTTQVRAKLCFACFHPSLLSHKVGSAAG